MFKFIPQSTAATTQVWINGEARNVPDTCSAWAAMAHAQQATTRLSPVTGEARSAYCAIGVCFECLVTINGLPNQQACMMQVAPGMRIDTQTITQTSIALLDQDRDY
ncbi:MAG TPA: sarcosine oxidase [Oceanospirillaceae bacterium]|nr:sarcosine oxidase [Oceanospirillaceae bacterium]